LLESDRRRWESETLGPHLHGRPGLQGDHTSSDIPVDVLYLPESTDEKAYLARLGFPGEYPFTRGVYPDMYRGRLWTFRQYAGFGTCEETNRRFRYLLEKGQTGLSVAFDLPTQMGYDSDRPISEGEVGRAGVAIDSVEDLERLFEGIPLDQVSTSMTINSTAPILLAMFIVVAEARGLRRESLAGTVQNDVLKEYVARGTYIFPPEPSLRLATEIFSFCSREMPRWNTISVSGYHIREAGSTAVQEVAFTLANGATYVDRAVRTGLDVDSFAPRMSFFFNSHNDFLEEIAKFRAARRLWADLMRNRFGARNPRSWMLRFHTQTAGSTLTAQQPLNNVVRVALQALAAVLGGTQSLHTNSFDEALSLPTEEAVRVALRTQQIIAHESGATRTVDPLGGSYYIEYLTEEIERRARAYLDRIEAMGGVIKAIETGFMKDEIEKSAWAYQREVESGKRTVVGLNRFSGEERGIRILRIDPAVEDEQRKRLALLRKRREERGVARSLAALESSARRGDNLLPLLIEAARSKATLGEICDVLRGVFGTFEEGQGQ
jgi:methylmalonyl-CoA mutase N-terminal domain/subunit